MRNLTKQRLLMVQSLLLALFLVCSAGLVACSSTTDTTTNVAAAPTPTLSLQMGMTGNLSPTPTPLAYTCGAWITQNTLPYGTDRIGVYAKFEKLVNGNPQGVDGATATATVHWPAGAEDTYTVQTTFDGLAVFTVNIGNHEDAINKITLVTIHFEKDGMTPCDVDTNRPAFFSLIIPSPAAVKGTPGTKGNPPGGH